MQRADLAKMIDHTLLAPAATPGQIALLCTDAVELGVAAVCVSPSRLPLPEPELPDDIATCTVVGFPSGAHHAAVKVASGLPAGSVVVTLLPDAGWKYLSTGIFAGSPETAAGKVEGVTLW